MTMRPIRVLFDASTFEDLRSGVARRFVELYSRILSSAGSDVQLHVVAGSQIEAELREALPAARIRPWPAESGRPWKRVFSGNPKLRRLADSLEVDYLHQDAWPLAAPDKTIPCIHDLRWLDRRFSTLSQRLYFRGMLPRTVRRCPLVITVSGFMRSEMIRHLGLPKERIRVIPNGIDPVGFRPPLAPSMLVPLGLEAGKYRLFVGHREPRKNLRLLLRVQASLVAAGDSLPLVIVGRKVAGYDEPERMIHALELEDHVRLLDSVPEDVLVQLYRGSSVFLMPSLYEGFGMTVLEAMAAETPVLCSNCGPFPEVAGGRALLAADDVEGWTHAVLELRDREQTRRAVLEGRRQLEKYRWEAAAKLQLEVYEELVRRRDPIA